MESGLVSDREKFQRLLVYIYIYFYDRDQRWSSRDVSTVSLFICTLRIRFCSNFLLHNLGEIENKTMKIINE